MLTEETQGFLRKIHPLDLLSEDHLAELVREVALEYFPRGDRILTQGGTPAEHLYLIKKGGVRVYVSSAPGEQIVIDDRSEEDYFGLISLISGDPPRASIVALEDTICYLIPKPELLAILQRNPAVHEKLLQSYLIHFLDKTYLETKQRYARNSVGHQALVDTCLGDIVRKRPITAPRHTPIREAARTMVEHRISSLVVTGEGGTPVGIVTDRDLRQRVVAVGRDLGQPLEEIMSSPLVGAGAEEHCFEALLKMMRHGIHHIAVLEGDRLRGVVTHHDFMVLQGASPAVLVREVAKTRSLDELVDTAARLRKTVSTLVWEGAKPYDVSAIISELAETCLNRIVDLGESERGPAPLPYTLFLLGDGGRRELTLDCRLELGIAYEDGEQAAAPGVAESYFGHLGEYLDQAQRTAGCAIGGHLRAEHILSFSGWRARFEGWAADPPREPRLGGFLDLRAIRGERRTIESLRLLLLNRGASGQRMRDALIAQAVANRPPLGFFRRFVVEKSGEHRDRLDLCAKGLRPLVEVVRISAFERGITALSTPDRLRELRAGLPSPESEEIEQALDYLMALLLHHQLAQIDEGGEPDCFLRPEDLAPREKKTLKEAFQLTARLYENLAQGQRGEGR